MSDQNRYKHFRVWAMALTLALSGGLLGVPGRASTILFDQTPTNTNSFSITEFRLADDFTLSSLSTVTDLLFYYTYSEGGSPSDLDDATYAIYANHDGGLGTVLQSATIASGSITRTGQSVLCPTCASATFSIAPLPLAGGTYWLELHNGASLTDNTGFEIGWGAVNDNADLIARFNASGMTPDTPVDSSGFNQYAFQVIGTTVPEPGALTLLVVGLSIIAVKACRSRRPVTKEN
jgi:hypothetical protein